MTTEDCTVEEYYQALKNLLTRYPNKSHLVVLMGHESKDCPEGMQEAFTSVNGNLLEIAEGLAVLLNDKPILGLALTISMNRLLGEDHPFERIEL